MTEPGKRMTEPGKRMTEPGKRMTEPGKRMTEPGKRMTEPGTHTGHMISGLMRKSECTGPLDEKSARFK